MSIGFEVLVIALLIIANGIFAMSEMAVITARKSRLQDWVNKGNARAKVALELAERPNQLLSSVQIGITLIGILTGAFAGRGAAEWLAQYLKALPGLEPYHQETALGLVVLIITFFSLVIGELVPKRLAMRHPESIATRSPCRYAALPGCQRRWCIYSARRRNSSAGCLAERRHSRRR